MCSKTVMFNKDLTYKEVFTNEFVSDEFGTISLDTMIGINNLFDNSDYIISYNGSKFDLQVLAKLNSDIKKLGQSSSKYVFMDAMNLITYDKHGNKYGKRYYSVPQWSSKHFDLLNNCTLSKSLKQWAMYMGEPIVELPYQPHVPLSKNMKKEIISYCHHDVDITFKIFLKYGLGNTRESMAGNLLTYIELQKLWNNTGLPPKFDRTLQSLSTGIIYETMTQIPPVTNQPLNLFDINQFDVPVDVKLIIAMIAKGQDIDVPEYKGIRYGKGGSHMIKKGLHKDITVFDVASQYPSILEQWKLLKTEKAQARYSEIKDWRLRLKHSGENRQLNEALKLVLNSFSGGLRIRNTFSVGYDPAAGEAMCYIGQLFITELALSAREEDLIEVNTDSIFVTGTDSLEQVRKKAKQMYEKYGLLIEEETIPMAYFKDVNNYIIYDETFKPVDGRGLDYKDMMIKQSEIAVYSEVFKNLPLDTLNLDWSGYTWDQFIFKYHRSAASKYAMIGDEPMTQRNYYFLWTTRECKDAKPINFSRDLINKKNGSIKSRFGVHAFDIKDLEKYKDFIDYDQYHRDLDDALELWGREDLCSTRLGSIQRKAVKSFDDIIHFIYRD